MASGTVLGPHGQTYTAHALKSAKTGDIFLSLHGNIMGSSEYNAARAYWQKSNLNTITGGGFSGVQIDGLQAAEADHLLGYVDGTGLGTRTSDSNHDNDTTQICGSKTLHSAVNVPANWTFSVDGLSRGMTFPDIMDVFQANSDKSVVTYEKAYPGDVPLGIGA